MTTPTARSMRAEREPHISESRDHWTRDTFAFVADALVLVAVSQPSVTR